jgi:hypothetical protein
MNPPVFKGPFVRGVTTARDILVLALGYHRVTVNVGVFPVLCVAPALDEAILETLRVGLLILGLPVGNMSVPRSHSLVQSYVDPARRLACV